MLRWCVCVGAVLLLAACSGEGEQQEIRKKAAAYQEAFNRHDAAALANMWAEDAEYVNPVTNVVLDGRPAIQEYFQALFAEGVKPRLELKINHIAFPEAQRAEEVGTAKVTAADGTFVEADYKALYEKRNGEWLLTYVNEVAVEEPPSHHQELKELEWLIGNWVDADEDSRVETSAAWDKYKNFITQRFTVSVNDSFLLEGFQLIGWDPATETIRSWVYDSDGGFGEGLWRKKDGRWVVETAYTLADGRKASAINIYTPVDEDTYTWESTGREVGGTLLPNLEKMTVVKQKHSGGDHE